MFSPEAAAASAPASTLRNPRRRRRNDSDGPRQLQPRKRSKINEDIFSTQTDSTKRQTHDDTSHKGINGRVNGISPESLTVQEIPVRDKRVSSYGQRPSRQDDGSILTRNPRYAVKHIQIPATLRSSSCGPFRPAIRCPNTTDLAVAFTHDQLLIWDYTSASAAPRSLNLPQSVKKGNTLPLGCIVTSSATSEIGLVIVSDSTGKITYWENIDSLEPVAFFEQPRHGVEGLMPGLLRGDTVDQIVGAEHAGYLLHFKSGCLAHFTIRDGQGRPSIAFSWLEHPANGGWLSGWTHTFTRSWKNAVVAFRTRSALTKGNVEVVAVTAEGNFKIWEVSWTGQTYPGPEYPATDDIKDALTLAEIAAPNTGDEIKVLDFALLSSSGEVAASGSNGVDALVLTLTTSADLSRYALLHLTFDLDDVQVRKVVPVSCYEPPSASSPSLAKLLVPTPEHTAFVIFDHAVVVAALGLLEASPEEQLFAEAGKQMSTYQDVVHLRQSKGTKIIQCANEPPSKGKNEESQIILCTQSSGFMRFTATSPNAPLKKSVRNKSLVQIKIEQAVMYGTESNILDLYNNAGLIFTQQEVEIAAVKISHDILRTDIDGLPLFSASLDQHLALRAKYLRELANYLRQHYPPLPRTVKWALMWDAERIASARSVWSTYEEHMKTDKTSEGPLLVHVVKSIPERHRTTPTSELGNLDSVRQFFLRDLTQLDRLFKMANNVIIAFHDRNLMQVDELMQWITEADDIIISCLGEAWKFRSENLATYGLENEKIKDGVLLEGYEDLPEFWTSRPDGMNAVRSCTRHFHRIAMVNYQKPGRAETIIERIAQQQPRLTLLCLLMHMERFRWLLGQPDEAAKESGRNIETEFDASIRHDMIMALAELGQLTEGMAIAEKLGDIATLVDLVIDEETFLQDPDGELGFTEAERAQSQPRMEELRTRIQNYFDKYGDEFASAYYAAQIRDRHLGDLLDRNYGSQQQLTNFLRSDRTNVKLGWINEVLNEKATMVAGVSLLNLASKLEQSAWSRKIELSISKLALLAERTLLNAEDGSTSDAAASVKNIDEYLDRNERSTLLSDIQERLYMHIRPQILAALDDASALENVQTTYLSRNLANRGSLYQLVEHGFTELLQHHYVQPDLLIEMLTTMDSIPCEDSAADISGQEFVLALQVLANSRWGAHVEQQGSTGEGLLRIIWKRLLIRADWKAINNTAGKMDKQQEAILRDNIVYRTLELLERSKVSLPRPQPQTCLTAFSTTNSLVPSRFPSADIGKYIAEDNAQDDKALATAIQKHDLERWFTVIAEMAKRDAAAAVAGEEADAKALKEFEEGWVEPDVGVGLVGDVNSWGLTVVVGDGQDGGYDGEEEGEYNHEDEGIGDVDME